MEKGLTSQEAKSNREKFGNNSVVQRSSFSPIKLFLAQFPNAINALLGIAALFSFLIGNSLDGVFIVAILLVNGLFSFFQEYRAQKALEKLRQYTTTVTRVIRNNSLTEIPTEEVTVGDIVVLEQGDKIPADGIISSGFHIEVDESIVTGESLPVVKDIGHQLLRGTFISSGKGHMRVEAIGMQTRFGQIAQTLATIETSATPLQKQIVGLSKLLSLLAVLLSLILVPIGMFQGRELFPLILLTISVAIAAIPESLPGVITIALSVGTNKLAQKGAIVRKMISVETLGSVQVILTDKTGTLTENNMVVKKSYLPTEKNLPALLEACLRGNNASLSADNHVIGDKTDGALLMYVKEKDGKYKNIIDSAQIIDEYAFDSKSKMITTVITRDKQTLAYMRGAPEELIARSTLSEKDKAKTIQEVDRLAHEGLRVIGFGYKKEMHNTKREHIETHITFLGLLGLYDKPRASARHAVESAKASGVRIVMVTGDNPLTALAIAKEVGLAKDTDRVVTGGDLKNVSETEFADIVQTVNVFARVEPEDKLRIATKLQELGFVVGVTGDGVNDSLALEKADVGIAMGEKGSDVAREAADIVLSNDDIAVLINAIHEGRRIYSSLVRAIMYLLAGNLAEILFVVVATLIDHPLPLLPTQILWINLVTDAFPALALASGTAAVAMSSHPRKPNSFLLSGKNTLYIIVAGLLMAALTFVSFSYLLPHVSVATARLVAFNVLIISELIFAFVMNRSLKSNLLLLIAGFTILAQFLISTLPIFEKLFQMGN